MLGIGSLLDQVRRAAPRLRHEQQPAADEQQPGQDEVDHARGARQQAEPELDQPKTDRRGTHDPLPAVAARLGVAQVGDGQERDADAHRASALAVSPAGCRR